MKIILEFQTVEECIEFIEKTAQENQVQEQLIPSSINSKEISKELDNYVKNEMSQEHIFNPSSSDNRIYTKSKSVLNPFTD